MAVLVVGLVGRCRGGCLAPRYKSAGVGGSRRHWNHNFELNYFGTYSRFKVCRGYRGSPWDIFQPIREEAHVSED